MKAAELVEGQEYAYDANARNRRGGHDSYITHVKVLKARDEIDVEEPRHYTGTMRTIKRTFVKVQVLTGNTGYGGLGRKGKVTHVPAVMLTQTWAEELEDRRVHAETQREWEQQRKERESRARKVRGRLRRAGLRRADFSHTPTQYVCRDIHSKAEFVFSIEAMENLLDKAGVK